ncbi:MAG TPA: hypothetical protein VKA15_08710 [Isosphaeraceae bacterium]|nr:hypothetical protein [Isosphaeraceae bacterium]
MPAQRVGSTAIAILRLDVVAQDASSEPGFIGHLALAGEDRPSYEASAVLPVLHMRPPLERAGECPANCVGSVGLTADEQLQIGLFYDEVESEYQAARARPVQQYVISPHIDEIRREDQTVVCRRFSCAGFVIEAYREARIDMLATGRDDLPVVCLDTLKTQYPVFARNLDHLRLREQLGIPGDGPWPVVLAGYVVNALNRPETVIRSTPYRAIAGDEFFPPRQRGESSPSR